MVDQHRLTNKFKRQTEIFVRLFALADADATRREKSVNNCRLRADARRLRIDGRSLR